MPGASGVELHAQLRRAGHDLPVVYLSGESTVSQTVDAMKLGAFDFLVKPFSREKLLSTIAAAIASHRADIAAAKRRRNFEESRAHLSPRERQVHDLLIKGYGNQEIMDALRISLPTAKQYKMGVMRKLGADSLAQLMARARAAGWLDP